MDSDQIRRTFLDYFVQRGHRLIPSASLVPHGDPTLLFTSAGMVPFKPYFMGLADPPAPRLTSIQKCFRTSDVDAVGDASHLTFFEMLGNFSVGDYFKSEAVGFAWELCTKVVGFPADRFWATVYTEDDEAFELWRRQGVPASRILRYGEAEGNFWTMGETGPCGPCSELHYDFGPQPGCPQCARDACHPAVECGRFLELWNLVFMTYYQAEDGSRTPLPKKNIDTGAGLERWAVVLQGKETVYETDLFAPVIAEVERQTGRRYQEDEATTRAIRVVAEHARAAAFLIADGVMPSNEGRGYVLRRVLRRAVYFLSRLHHGHGAGSMLERIAAAVIDVMGAAYPDLADRGGFVLRVLAHEEEKFAQTLERGAELLDQMVEEERAGGSDLLPGDRVFLLHDTFGLPRELTAELARERGLRIDDAGFEREMAAQRERARAATKFEFEEERLRAYRELAHIRTRFLGYERLTAETTVAGLIGPSGVADSAEAGEDVELVLLETPFYAEGGGQVGDTGWIASPTGRVRIQDTQAAAEGLVVHRGRVEEGWIAVNDVVTASVDGEKRLATMRNHTATHLLHAALRRVLGTHVRQAGSLVAPDRLRFDFTHIGGVKAEELREVQRLVNEKIRQDVEVGWRYAPYQQAVEEGAMALFGEKYGDEVRVVEVCEPEADACFSRELCGGTHCLRTGQIGLFLIVSEGSIGSGLRRIEALTGAAAEEYVVAQAHTLRSLADRLSVPVDEVERRVASLLEEVESQRRRIQALEREVGRREVESLVASAERLDGAAVLAARVAATSFEAMREMGDLLRDRLKSAVVVLAAAFGDRPNFLAMVTPDLTGRVHAGDLVKQVAAVTGGGGGGRPDMAQAGGKDISRLDEALGLARTLARERLSSPKQD